MWSNHEIICRLTDNILESIFLPLGEVYLLAHVAKEGFSSSKTTLTEIGNLRIKEKRFEKDRLPRFLEQFCHVLSSYVEFLYS